MNIHTSKLYFFQAFFQTIYAQQNQQQNEPVQPQDNFVTENSQDSEENKIEDMDDGVSD